MPARSKNVVVLAHCHLNVMTKVRGLADYAGVRTEVVIPFIEAGTGILQLPCPEATYAGMRRWGETREQYDVRAYRRHCRRLLEPVVDAVSELVSDGCRIERVIGVEGSPSCGVHLTCAGYTGGELPDHCPTSPAEMVPGRGVFMEEFEALLSEAGLDIPFEGIAERVDDAPAQRKDE